MGFHNTWNMVMSELQTAPDPGLLQYWYFKQVQYFKPMSEDIAHYKRAKGIPGDPDYSFERLWGASCRYLTMKREDSMQDALNRSLKYTHSKALVGPEVRPKKGKGGNKDTPTSRPKSAARPQGGPKNGARGRSSSRDGKGKSATKSARYAFQKGPCNRGAESGYSHTKEGGRSPTPRANTPGPKGQKLCTFHAQGTCKFGKDCRDKHTGGARSPSPRKGKDGKGKGKGKKPAVAAVEVSMLHDTTPSRGPGSVALAAATYLRSRRK